MDIPGEDHKEEHLKAERMVTLVADRTREAVALRTNCLEETTDTLAISPTTVDQDIKLFAHCHRNEHSPGRALHD